MQIISICQILHCRKSNTISHESPGVVNRGNSSVEGVSARRRNQEMFWALWMCRDMQSSVSTSGARWFSLYSSIPGKVSGFQEGLSAWYLEDWLSVRGWFEQPK